MTGFRFGAQILSQPPAEFAARAAEAEQAGFDVVSVADHIGHDWSPLLALGAAAQATDRVQLGTLVLNCCFHHPLTLAREVASLDHLSGGRVELGIGAGHNPHEFAATGIPLEDVTRRKERLASHTTIVRALLDGETVDRHDDYYDLTAAALKEPAPSRVPILVGGGGRPLLTHAAQHADIIGLAGAGKPLADGLTLTVKWQPWRLDRQVEIVRNAAGDQDVELNALVQMVTITDDRERVIRDLVTQIDGLDVEDAIETPFLAIGTVDEIAAQLDAARERWGISYFTVREVDAFAPVIAALR